MPKIIAIITLLPFIVALLLRGKYYKRVLILAPLNLAINVIAFEATKPSFNSCNSYAHTDCSLSDQTFWLYVIITILNIALSVYIWMLAFSRKQVATTTQLNTPGGSPITSQVAPQQNGDKEGLRKLLGIAGGLIVFGLVVFVLLLVTLVFYAFSQI